MNEEQKLFLLQTFESNQDTMVKPYLDLGWTIIGTMRKPNDLRPEKGDFIFVNLQWPNDSADPVYPK